MPSVKMQVHTDSDKAWVFSTQDYADQEGSFETFCIRFGSPERKPRIPIGGKTKSSGLMRITDGQQIINAGANEFKEKYEEAGDLNRGLLDRAKEEEEKKEDATKPSPEAEKLAEDLEKSAKVEDKAE